MLRSLGQVLALFALMASVVNAQCAMSCSLQTGLRSQIPASPAHRVSGVAHACCPASRIPTNAPPRPQGPCSEQQAGVGAVEITRLQHWEVPSGATLICESAPALLKISLQSDHLEFRTFSGWPDRAAFSEMRV